MRVTYCRELKVKEELEARDVNCFVPMTYKRQPGDSGNKRLVPAIHNLIFVFASSEKIKEIKAEPIMSDSVRFIMDRELHRPMTIPTRAMEDFIRISESRVEETLYLTPEELQLKEGDLVRVKTGIWEGITGRFVRIKRGLRVVVELNGIMAVATTSMPPHMIEKI